MVKKTILVNNKYKVTLETVHQPKIDQQLVIYQPKDLKIDMFYSGMKNILTFSWFIAQTTGNWITGIMNTAVVW